MADLSDHVNSACNTPQHVAGHCCHHNFHAPSCLVTYQICDQDNVHQGGELWAVHAPLRVRCDLIQAVDQCLPVPQLHVSRRLMCACNLTVHTPLTAPEAAQSFNLRSLTAAVTAAAESTAGLLVALGRLISSMESTVSRQMGHLDVCFRSSVAQSPHMHICLPEHTVLSQTLRCACMQSSMPPNSSKQWNCSGCRTQGHTQQPEGANETA